MLFCKQKISGYFQFAGNGQAVSIEIVVGLSLIDVATAQRNAAFEIPASQSFDETRSSAQDAWRSALGRIDAVVPKGLFVCFCSCFVSSSSSSSFSSFSSLSFLRFLFQFD